MLLCTNPQTRLLESISMIIAMTKRSIMHLFIIIHPLTTSQKVSLYVRSFVYSHVNMIYTVNSGYIK